MCLCFTDQYPGYKIYFQCSLEAENVGMFFVVIIYISCVSDLRTCQKWADAVAIAVSWCWVSISKMEFSSIPFRTYLKTYLFDTSFHFKPSVLLEEAPRRHQALFCCSGKHQALGTFSLQAVDSAR